MRNEQLADLNFKTLLHYGIHPNAGARPFSTIPCTGFCVSCEKKGLLDDSAYRLDQMSHGADTDDFEKAICKLPPGGTDVSVAFLLETPGGYYDNGTSVLYSGVKKNPPVNVYYWVPQLSEWPTNPLEVQGTYGDYFAYILAKHGLHNAYFTNCIKCSLAEMDVDRHKDYYVVRDPDNRETKIRDNCYNLFLSQEMRLVNPQIVFFFGQKADKMATYQGIRSQLPESVEFVRLYHPVARFVSPSRILQENDRIIASALKKVDLKL